MLNEEAGDVESEAGEVRSLAGMVGGEKRGRGIPARAPETTREGAHAPPNDCGLSATMRARGADFSYRFAGRFLNFAP